MPPTVCTNIKKMNEERAFVIKLVGRDIYQLLLKYLLRALRSQFNLQHNLRKWPNNSRNLEPGPMHSVMVYLAKHALMTMYQFHNLFSVCKQRWKRFRVFNCLCGKQFGSQARKWPDFNVAYTTNNEGIDVVTLNIINGRECVACDNCSKRCYRCSKRILCHMASCGDCERRKAEEIQNVEAIQEWLKLQKYPF